MHFQPTYTYFWQDAFFSAAFELDITRVPARIRAAEEAMFRRFHEISGVINTECALLEEFLITFAEIKRQRLRQYQEHIASQKIGHQGRSNLLRRLAGKVLVLCHDRIE